MPANLQHWIDHLKQHPLPAMALTAQQVSTQMGRTRTTHSDYQRIIARDPGFALSIFRYLGELPKPPREPVTSLVHAVALAGLAPLALGTKRLPLIKSGEDVTRAKGLLHCYSRSAHAALFLSHWAQIRRDANPDELLLAALLHDCGEMALWSTAPGEMARIEARINAGVAPEEAAVAQLGFTLPELSQGLAEVWRLPALIVSSAQPAGAFQSRSLGVMLACALARSSSACWDSEQTLTLIELAAEYCRQTIDQAAAGLHSCCAEAARQLHGLPLPISAPALLQLTPRIANEADTERVEMQATAVEHHTPERSKVESANQSARFSDQARPSASAPNSTQSSATGMEVTTHPRIEPDAPIDPSTIVAPPVQKNNPAAGSSLQYMLSGIMRQIVAECGVERAMFAMITPDRRSLRARFILGATKEAKIRTFQVGLEKRHLFSALLLKQQSFWLNQGNREKYLTSIPEELHILLNIDNFFVGSLFAAGTSLGIIYGDCGSAGNLDQASFNQFKQLLQHLNQQLAENTTIRIAS
ncbi:MAG: HDOD domain-containing protein [Gammaproteobacteria bacterium]|nr:HDOD domain-containing protein [Gammaproteobacteria bacterium]